VAARGFIGHSRQVFHVDMDVSRLVSLEGAVLRLLFLGREIAQVSHAMPPQVRRGQKTIWEIVFPDARSKPEREAFGFRNARTTASRSSSETGSVLAQGHRSGFVRWRQRRLQAVRRVAAVVNSVAVFPFMNRLLSHAKPLRENRCRRVARPDRRPDLRRRRRLLMKMDQHGRPPSRSSLKTDLAMNKADRRGSM